MVTPYAWEQQAQRVGYSPRVARRRILFWLKSDLRRLTLRAVGEVCHNDLHAPAKLIAVLRRVEGIDRPLGLSYLRP